MGAPLLQEDAGDREIPCPVAPLQSSTAVFPACIVFQHPYLMYQSRWTRESCLESLRRMFLPDEPKIDLHRGEETTKDTKLCYV